ncbi:MAG: GHKL domain-containing protein [Planctomycetaceae bacterium]|nr:GHKL domain-containing protein [Planctomycetaceae bacterium]
MLEDVAQDIFVKDVKINGDSLVLQSLPIGVVVFDKTLKIQNANRCAYDCINIQMKADATLAAGTNENIWGNWHAILTGVLNTGKSRRFDNVSYLYEDKSALLQIICSAMKDDGVITGGIILLENVTEKATLQKQYAQTERLAALGKLASKVAHELNNPMDGVLRYINLAKRIVNEHGLTKPVEYLDNAGDGLKRMIGIITELLEFSRNRHSSLEDTTIDKIIEEAIKYNEPMANTASVEIQRQYTTPLPKAKCGNLFQVFCNLIKNAIEAMHDGGKIIITCDVSDDNIAAIKFRDTGKGIDPAVCEAIFEPFFSTKTGRKGTGLGLAICRDIIEKHGGKITAQNASDSGSIFTVYLPVNK